MWPITVAVVACWCGALRQIQIVIHGGFACQVNVAAESDLAERDLAGIRKTEPARCIAHPRPQCTAHVVRG